MKFNLTTHNKQAIYNVLKGLLVAGGPLAAILTNQFGMDDGTVKTIIESGAAIVSIVGLLWLGAGGTDKAVVQQAAEVKGVQVHVDTARAPEAVVEVAQSTNPDVWPMVGGPRSHEKDAEVAAAIVQEEVDKDLAGRSDGNGYRTLK